jgi:hypothetical protein
MTTFSSAFLKSHLLKLHALTERWRAQVFFYLVLAVVFFVIDQTALFIYRHLFNYDGSAFGWFLLTGAWIPGIANVIAIVMTVRARTLMAYLLIVAVLNYFLAIAYHFTTGLDIIFAQDYMGGLGAAVVWSIVWFWGGVIGLVIKLLMWGRRWHINSK